MKPGEQVLGLSGLYCFWAQFKGSGHHDLQRTVATCLGDDDIGTDPIVVEKILNHQLQGMRKVYNLQEYMKKRVEALKAWGSKHSEVL